MATGEKQVTPEQAAAELVRRRRARDSLVDYARAIDIPGAPASEDPEGEIFKPVETAVALHHRVTMEAIQRTMTRKRGRLIIMEPPGSAKSTYASVVAPSWAMQKWNGYRIILASYNTDLAIRHSRKARALCRSRRSQSIWEDPPTLATDQKAADDWSLSNGSNYMAAGFQSGITGNRANGLIVDDPVKNREDADSDTMREKVKEEFRESAKTRLLPNGWIIIIQTRWHQDDLTGSILPENYNGESGFVKCRDGQVWEVLNIPAKMERVDDPLGREPGEYLWPEWFPREHWEEFENDPQGKRTWASLFQQRPAVEGGLQFRKEDFKWYDPDIPVGEPGGLPKGLFLCGASDNATKEGGGDFTEHCIGGLDAIGDLWFVDWWYKQARTDVTIGAAVSMMRRHRPQYWGDEGGPIDKAIGPARNKMMREAKPPLWTQIETLTSIKNKQIKLGTLEAWAAAGRVWLPLKRPWAERLVQQLCDFPTGKYDDAADCAGLLARLLDKMVNARVESKQSRPKLVPFSVEWLEFQERPEGQLRFS